MTGPLLSWCPRLACNMKRICLGFEHLENLVWKERGGGGLNAHAVVMHPKPFGSLASCDGVCIPWRHQEMERKQTSTHTSTTGSRSFFVCLLGSQLRVLLRQSVCFFNTKESSGPLPCMQTSHFWGCSGGLLPDYLYISIHPNTCIYMHTYIQACCCGLVTRPIPPPVAPTLPPGRWFPLLFTQQKKLQRLPEGLDLRHVRQERPERPP